MKLLIDASNIRAGGGVVNLLQLLRSCDPREFGFDIVDLWAHPHVLEQCNSWPWLQKKSHPIMGKGPLGQYYFQHRIFPEVARTSNATIGFIPGGLTGYNLSIPHVCMAQNLLPFDPVARGEIPLSDPGLKLRVHLLQKQQGRSLKRADGIIFLSNFAIKQVRESIGNLSGKIVAIPQGASEIFFAKPRIQRPVHEYSTTHPFSLVYLSCIDFYKHQWTLAQAVSELRSKGYPITVDFVGPVYTCKQRFQKALERYDSRGTFLRWVPGIPHKDLPGLLRRTDAFVFASSCEASSTILMEGMASGLPIACSNLSSMPETLGDAGLFFNPYQLSTVVKAIELLFNDHTLRATLAAKAHERAKHYTWERCAAETFAFLKSVAEDARKT